MKASLFTLALSVLSSAACAQPASLVDAEILDGSKLGGPARAAQKVDDGWFALSIPAIEGTRSTCCWRGNWTSQRELGCSLDEDYHSYGNHADSPIVQTVMVYAHVTDGTTEDLKIVGARCPMDAAGASVTWLGATDDRDTVDWLDSLARDAHQDKVAHSALWALSLHASDRAGDRLYELAREPDSERAEEAIFWLGEARGQAGYEALASLLNELPAGEVRRHINFALSQNDSDDSTALLIETAHDDHDPEQRSMALFWLAQKHPQVAAELLHQTVRTEQNREVLEQAVFAMSQLPPETGGPMLLELARDPDAPREARRQALFWLANSDHEESVSALTEMLTR